jgi:hypothetical protein
MAMDKETFRELCMAHALGALEGRDADLFQRALAEADEERMAIFAEAVALAQNLSLAAPAAEPSPAVKSRLMAKVTGEAASAEPERAPAAPRASAARPKADPSPGWRELFDSISRWFGPGLAFASAAIGVGVLVYAFSLKGSLGRQEAALEATRVRVSQLEDTLSKKDALLEVLLSHNLQVAVLSGEGPSPTGYGKMIWCPKRRCGILHVANLPPVPDGHDYQLWLLRDGSPVNSGVFQVKHTSWDGDLFRIQGMSEVSHDKVKGFIVTLEPKGGAAAPSGETYLKGSTLM